MATVKIELYKDADAKYRWRLVTNGRIVADSGEGYDSKGNCRRAMRRMQDIKKLKWTETEAEATPVAPETEDLAAEPPVPDVPPEPEPPGGTPA